MFSKMSIKAISESMGRNLPLSQGMLLKRLKVGIDCYCISVKQPRRWKVWPIFKALKKHSSTLNI